MVVSTHARIHSGRRSFADSLGDRHAQIRTAAATESGGIYATRETITLSEPKPNLQSPSQPFGVWPPRKAIGADHMYW